MKAVVADLIERAYQRIPYWMLEARQVLDFVEAHAGTIRRQGRQLRIRFDGGVAGPVDFLLRRDSSDYGSFLQVFAKGEYRALIDLVSRNVNAQSVRYVVDAGANIGCSTIFLARSFPNATIVSIEPDAGNYSQLTANLEINELKRVRAVRAALWPREGLLTVHRSFRDSRDWSIRVKESPELSDGVRAITSTQVMQNHSLPRIDVFKIDIEGAEGPLFGDRAAVDYVLDRTRFLAVEIHDEICSRPAIEQTLRQHGFELVSAGQTTLAFKQKPFADQGADDPAL